MSFFSHSEALTAAKEIGLHEIRCSLTGQVIAELGDSTLIKSIEFEQYQNPFANLQNILDSLETRWLIQSSRPAPHLTAHQSKDGFLFLREFYSLDLFAILASRLVFENTVAVRSLESTGLKRTKMLWLRELQESFSGGALPTNDIVDALIRLDAIHDIRNVLYSHEIRNSADLIRTNAFDMKSLIIFINEVENCGFIALSKMKNPPEGNSMAMSAALRAAGVTPDQIIRAEEREMKVVENRRRAIESVNSKNAGKNGSIKINRGVKAVFSLSDLGEALPPKLAEKYAKELESRKPTKANQKTGDKRPTKAAIAAAARFGNLDIEW